MEHRHLIHQQFTLAAIDDIISRGKREDWATLRTALLNDPSVREKILRVCAAHIADPYAQRYHFWKQYVERLPNRGQESERDFAELAAADMEWLFPEYDFAEMDLDSYRGVIIERVLERGSWEQVRWLFDTYGEAAVANWLRRHGFRLLSSRSFALWRLALDVETYEAPAWAVAAKQQSGSW